MSNVYVFYMVIYILFEIVTIFVDVLWSIFQRDIYRDSLVVLDNRTLLMSFTYFPIILQAFKEMFN
jgi:hypothetical protein